MAGSGATKIINFVSGPGQGATKSVIVASGSGQGATTLVNAVHGAGYGATEIWIAVPGAGYGATEIVMVVGCFPKSALVHVESDTYRPIGAIKIGDKVSSWNAEQKKVQFTAVTKIHNYKVMEIICFNKALRVSSSHPLMVIERDGNGILVPKWKTAMDVNVGDCVVGTGGKFITVKSKSNHWYNTGTEVLNLSTDNGVPFLVGNCVVRAENAIDDLEWAERPLTQKLCVVA